MSTRKLPDLVEAFAEYMGSSDAPKQYIKWAMLGVVAGALERKVWLVKDHDTGWYPNLYLFLVGPAGSGKSTVAESAVSFLYELDGVDFLSDDINGASLFEDLRSIGARKKFSWMNDLYPHSAATLFSSEASETFSAQYKNDGLITKLTSLYNGGLLGWHMKHGTGRSTLGGGRHTVLNPCINILACSTAQWLITKCITKNDAAGGFGSRIILVVAKEELRARNEWESASQPKDMNLRRDIIEDLRAVHKMQGPFHTSPCFRDAWSECTRKYNAWKEMQASQGIMGGYQQRKLTQLCKVTMCLAAARRSDLVLMGKDLEDAWSMLNEIEPAMIEVLDELELSPEARLRREIIGHLRRTERQQVTKAEIHRLFPKQDHLQVEMAIKGLVTVGKLVATDVTASRTLYQIIGVY